MSGRAPNAVDDAAEAALALVQQRREAEAMAREAVERRHRAAAHAGGPLDPRAQGLWAAATFHAARARAAAERLRDAEAVAATIRARAETARRADGGPDGEAPCA